MTSNVMRWGRTSRECSRTGSGTRHVRQRQLAMKTSTNRLPTSVVLAGLVRGALAATTADVLTHAGAGCIIFTGRSQPELQTVIDHINRKHPQAKIIFITADTGSLASMRAAAKAIKELDVPIDGIVAFPSVMGAEWELTPDGIESHFQKNYLAYFVLVNELMVKMSSGSRTVLLTTSVRREAPAPKWDDANFSVRGTRSATLLASLSD